MGEDQPAGTLTRLLAEAGSGDKKAQNKFAELLYQELREAAKRLFKRGGSGSLQPTALVNEFFLKLCRQDCFGDLKNRKYFFTAAIDQMRKILVSMLYEIGIPEVLGTTSANHFFDPTSQLVIRCSVLRHPVFVAGKNYTGHHPPLTRSDFLMAIVQEYFGRSIQKAPNALLVPLGKAVETVLHELDLPNPTLWGFPYRPELMPHWHQLGAAGAYLARRTAYLVTTYFFMEPYHASRQLLDMERKNHTATERR